MDIKMGVLNPFPVYIGHEGENGVESVTFDFSPWVDAYGEGVLNLLIRRPTEADPYPVVLTVEDQTATWTISDTDTELLGQGEAQLIYIVDDKIKKSDIFELNVCRSLSASGDAPDPYESWIDTLVQLGAVVEQNAQAAAQSAADASGSASSASESADASAESARLAGLAQTAAETSEANAEESAQIADRLATEAELSATDAVNAAQSATESAQAASRSAQSASDSASGASRSAQDASDSATAADQSAQDAQASAEEAERILSSKVTGAGLTLTVDDGVAVLTY